MQSIRVLGLADLIASTPAMALEQGEYRLIGFGTAAPTHLGGEDQGRSFGINGQITDAWRGDQLAKLGGQLQCGLTDKLNVTVQASVKSEQDTWKGNLEWAYLSLAKRGARSIAQRRPAACSRSPIQALLRFGCDDRRTG